MLATFVVRLVLNGGADEEVAGQVEAIEGGARAVFRNADELLAFLRRDPEGWRAEP